MLFSIINIGKENVGLRFYTQHKEVCNMSKRIISILGVLILLCGLVPAGCAEETVTFSWWIPRNEDTSYYDNYRQNPVIQYTLDTKTYAGKKLELEFQAGISGSERENFSNMLSTESLTDVFNLAYCLCSWRVACNFSDRAL